MKKIITLVIAFLCLSHFAIAQSIVVSPKTLQFEKSADHDAVDQVTLTPVINKYIAHIGWLNESGAPMDITVDLGKPTPGADGKTIVFSSWSGFTGLKPGIKYTVVVSAIGYGGLEAPSVASDPFGFPRPPSAPGRAAILP